VSHSKERAEKNCLNCGETVQGRYCQVCGQENIEPKESIWGLVSHFFQDITHFDGKFFSTGKLLLAKPGFLPKEYLSGRRARYLHPIRMYVFTSALFFLIFYSVFNVRNLGLSKNKDKQQIANLAEAKARALKTANSKEDSAQIEQTFKMIGQLPINVTIDKDDVVAEDDEPGYETRPDKIDTSKNHTTIKNDTSATTRKIYRYNSSDTTGLPDTKKLTDTKASTGKNALTVKTDSAATDKSADKKDAAPSRSKRTRGRDDFGLLDLGKAFTNAYESRAQYDSVQASLPEDARDNWLKRRLAYQNIEFKQRYGDDQGELMQDLLDKFVHTFPYLLFISLPLYALFLKLLYIRRKKFFYADHGLFLIYLYIFTFLHLLVLFGLRALKQHWDHWSIGLIIFIFIMYGIYYAYKSMRKFYEQGRAKTILKFLILNFLAFTTITFLFALFFFIALLRL
jgi:hypothetical protein